MQTDHRMILAVLWGEGVQKNGNYQRRIKCFPIKLQTVRPHTEGGGGIRETQGGDRQDASANDGAIIMDLPGDLDTGGLKDGAPENREGQREGGKTGATGVYEINSGGQTTESPICGNIHWIAHGGRQGPGGLGADLAVVPTGEGTAGPTNY